MSFYIRVNSTTEKVRIFDLPQEQKLFGGRGRVSQVLYSEMDPVADPLSSKNVIVFTIGMLAKAPLSCFDAVYIGTKSPLSGKLSFTHFMSRAARMLAEMGVYYIVFEGIPTENKQYVLVIERGKAALVLLDELIGTAQVKTLGAFQLQSVLRQVYGKNSCVISYGSERIIHSPVSSLLVSGASEGSLKNIMSNGVSEVFASKGIKAIVVKGIAQGGRDNRTHKTSSACHELESLLMCSRIYASLKNTPYGHMNLCRQCMNGEWLYTENSFEALCTDSGIFPVEELKNANSICAVFDKTNFVQKIADLAFDDNLYTTYIQAQQRFEDTNHILAAFENMGFCAKALHTAQYERVLSLLQILLENYYPKNWSDQQMLDLGIQTIAKEEAFNSWGISSFAEQEQNTMQLLSVRR